MAPADAERPLRAPAGRALVFVGFMGAGKTTAARRLARRSGWSVVDADATIAEHIGMPIDRCFAEQGEAAFRAIEAELVGELLERADGGVFSLGGGALHSERIRAALRRHITVLLDVDVNVAWERAAGRGRPLARDPQEFRDLYVKRRPLYMAAADVVLPADRRDRVDDALPSILALRATRPRAPACCGRRPPRATTRCSSGAGCSARRSRRVPGPGLPRDRRPGRSPLRERARRAGGGDRDPGRRAAQVARDGRARVDRARRAAA